MLMKASSATLALLGALIAPVHADQAECEMTVRALLYPWDENKPGLERNRFGEIKQTIDGTKMGGFSLQTPDGSLFFDQDKNPVSLSFTTGETFWSPDKGKSWKLSNANSKEVMEAEYAKLRKQADEATNITCEYGITFEAKTVNHYSVDFIVEGNGDKAHQEFWVDAETGFGWRDIFHSTGSADVYIEGNYQPAPDMILPPKPEF